ncbi:MAG TPA: hypothetical protein VLT47_04025 [Anaeromyxobacteraceae bacterium]|nr:hypothetical protein [Anaeromyxobacteraceae bacterium]
MVDHHAAAGHRSAALLALPAVLLAVAVLVPFRDKAYTIDDTVFLEQARHATVDPLHPSAFEMVTGEGRGRLVISSGPVMAWLLVPAALAGGAEWAAHAAQLAMLCLAIVATVALALRLGLAEPWAATAGLIVASAPAVLGMAGTAMPDVPAMALGVLGLERLVAWSRERRSHQAATAAAALALAPLARPHVVLLLGVGALLVERPSGAEAGAAVWRRRLVDWVPLALATALAATIFVGTQDPISGAVGPVAATASVSASSFVGPNAIAFPVHWVLALPLAVPLLLARPRLLRERWPVFAGGVAAVAIVAELTRRGPFYYAVIAGIGVAVLWDVVADAWRGRDPAWLALGLWLFVALAAVPYPHLPPKYLLASAPAAAILVARALAAAPPVRARWIAGVTCVVGVALGVAILRADAAFAGLARRAATELVKPHVAGGAHVWSSARWGFQWYAEQAGARQLTTHPPYPALGDLIVVSRNTDRGGSGILRMLESYPRLTRVGYLADSSPGGRVMDRRLRAGFFSNHWGLLPWRWGRTVLDEFELLRIDALPPR